MEVIASESGGKERLEEIRNKYSDPVFVAFVERQRKEFDREDMFAVRNFLSEQSRKTEDKLDFLKKSAVMLLDLSEGSSIFHSRQVTDNWLESCNELMVIGELIPDDDTIGLLKGLLDKELDLLVDVESKRGKPGAWASTMIALFKVAHVPGFGPVVEDAVGKALLRENVLDRNEFANQMDVVTDSDVAMNIYCNFFESADPSVTLDMSEVMGRGKFWQNVQDHLKGVDGGSQLRFWRALSGYIDRRHGEGYGTALEESMREFLIGNEYFKDLDIPIFIQEKLDYGVETETVEVFTTRDVWQEIVGDSLLDEVYEMLASMAYEDRREALADKMPDTDPVIREFIAQVMNRDIQGNDETIDDWQTWAHHFEIEFPEVVASEPVKRLWSLILKHPQVLAHQLALWLANFPVNSLADLGLDRVDVVEGVRLDARHTSLCGYAEMYMMQSLNMDAIESFYGGNLLLKKQGVKAALCTKTFRVVGPDGTERVFLRGYFYEPATNESDRWYYSRKMGGNYLNKTSGDLMILADKWVKKNVSGKLE